MGELDEDDVADLLASWRRFPPVPLALQRIEDVLMTAFRLERQAAPPAAAIAPDAPTSPPPSPEQMEMLVRALNAQLVNRVPRV